MKARYGFIGQSKKALTEEIDRQIIAQKEKFMRDIDVMILWTLHVELGFGKKRIERFYNAVIRNFKELCDRYEMKEVYPAELKLREIGVDIDELRKGSAW